MLVAAAALPVAQGRPRELANVQELGAAAAEFDNGLVQAVVASLLLAAKSRLALAAGGIRSQQPPGGGPAARPHRARHSRRRVVPLAAQRAWGEDSTRARQLLQEAEPARHQVRSYFRQIADQEPLRFFGRPEQGQTVFDQVSVSFDRILIGDLLFASPRGAWARGRHVLVVRLEDEVVQLPIDLR